MAKSPSPWSVKGVEPEAREAAKIAARKAGLTVGAWLTQMIRQSASDQLRNGGKPSPGPEAAGHDQPQPRSHPSQRSDQSNERYFSENETWQPPPSTAGLWSRTTAAARRRAPSRAHNADGIREYSAAVEPDRKRRTENCRHHRPNRGKIAELSKQLENAKDGGSTSTAPVERAIQKIAERLDRIESGPGPTERTAPRPVGEPRPPERRGFLGLFRRD